MATGELPPTSTKAILICRLLHVRIRPWTQLHDFQLQSPEVGERHCRCGWRTPLVHHRYQHGKVGVEPKSVQLYVADTATGMTLHAQEIVGFAQLDLESGALRKVSFVIPLSLLGYTRIAGNFVIKPGRWRLAQVAARATFALVQSLPSLERCALSAKSAVPFSPSRKSARTCDPDTITYSHQ